MCKFLFVAFVIMTTILFSGCTTQRERRGVSYAPFNAPESSGRRTFDGDF